MTCPITGSPHVIETCRERRRGNISTRGFLFGKCGSCGIVLPPKENQCGTLPAIESRSTKRRPDIQRPATRTLLGPRPPLREGAAPTAPPLVETPQKESQPGSPNTFLNDEVATKPAAVPVDIEGRGGLETPEKDVLVGDKDEPFSDVWTADGPQPFKFSCETDEEEATMKKEDGSTKRKWPKVKRKVAKCLDCKEPKEIMARGLCVSCLGKRKRNGIELPPRVRGTKKPDTRPTPPQTEHTEILTGSEIQSEKNRPGPSPRRDPGNQPGIRNVTRSLPLQHHSVQCGP